MNAQLKQPVGATEPSTFAPVPLTHRLVRFIRWVTDSATTAPHATVLIRLMAGAVFVSEGVLKFVYTNQGVGRFTKLGFPFPEATATAIGAFEIVGGLLLLAGLYTRLVAIGFSVEMMVAMLTTKISLYLGTSPLPLPAAAPKTGIWAVLHETRSDWAQLLCCLFLVVVGAGALSLDARRRARAITRDEEESRSRSLDPELMIARH